MLPAKGGLCRSAKSVNVAVMLRAECERRSEREAKRAQALSSLALHKRRENEYDTTETNHIDHFHNQQAFSGNSGGEYELLEDGDQQEFDVDQPQCFQRFRFEFTLFLNLNFAVSSNLCWQTNVVDEKRSHLHLSHNTQLEQRIEQCSKTVSNHLPSKAKKEKRRLQVGQVRDLDNANNLRQK